MYYLKGVSPTRPNMLVLRTNLYCFKINADNREYEGLFRTLSKIYDAPILRKITIFAKKLHHRFSVEILNTNYETDICVN